MLQRTALTLTIIVFSAHSALAQQQTKDCNDPDNASEDICLGLPIGSGVTNFAPLIAPLLGLAAATALVGGGGGSTPSTTN